MNSDLSLSAAQLGVWYALKAGISPPAYNIGEYIKIFGAIDPSLFERAVRHVVTESEALRLRFAEHDGVPRQQVTDQLDWTMTYRDLSAEHDPVAAAEAWMRADLAQPLDLHCGPFFTFALFKAAPGQFIWYGRFHHLIMDALGGALIVRRISEVYAALAGGSTVDCKTIGSLAGLVREDAAYRASAQFQSDRQFWVDLMADCPEPPSLGIDFGVDREGLGTPMEVAEPLRQTVLLPASAVAQLQAFGERVELTFPQVVTLCAAIFIHRLTEAEDVVLGQLMAARMSRTTRQTPGMLANVVPLRVAIRPDMPVEELAVQVRRAVRAGIRHQRYNIADLRRDLRRIDRPVVRQLISLRPSYDDARFAGFPVAACTVSNGPVDDLNIFVVYDLAEQGDTRIEFVANPAAYDQETLARLQCRFLRLLAAVDDPAALIGTLDMLPPDERRQILIDRNQTDAGYPHCRQIHELFEEQARRTPDRVAAVFERQRLTYRELNEQADRVARNLALLGVGPNERVALHVERSLGMLIGLLGILKAGGAYVPLDPNYPRDRLEFILEDCEPLVLLTEQSLRDRLQPRNAATLCLDAMPLQPAVTGPAINLRQASDLAYVLYTSGSTGQPKGVQIPHRAMVNFLCAMRREPGIAAEDRLLAVTSLSFDIAGLELLLPLICGAQVTIAPGEIAASGVYLARLMRDSGATIMQATPATWKILLESGWQGSRDLRILCGGEAWSADLADALLARCASLWNMYGPTETTVWSSVARIERHQPVLIGPPIANTVFYVLDRYRQPVPFGVPGELFIGGDGVARGYLNRPELTRERFVADPFSDKPAARMYQTGDRVRQRSDGRLEFLGRLDHQVKIRGFRIETGEIEVVLRRHPGVRDAVVVARADRTGENRLLAYVIAGGPKPVAVGELRDFLRRKLTPYMVPAAIIPLDAFPLTPNGKVDRNALPLPADQARRDTGVEWIAPRTPSEQLVARLWCDCLQLGQVGINDNFFDLGGDSLAMLRLGLEIERATGQSFPTTYIFNAPTVAGMARILGGRKAISNRSPVVLLRPGSDGPPVFMVHPISGSTVQLIPVAQAFPGRNTIYGIQARGLDGIDAANDRVESMVEYYLNAITELQPHGPYLLMGLCFGGLVAIEIARRLTERGETIDMLACLDTFPHPRYCPFKLRLEYYLIHRVKEAVKTLRGMNRQEMVSYVTTKLKLLLRQSAAQVTGRRSLPTASDFLPPAIKTVFESSVAAAMHYRPLYYAGKMNFLVGGYHAYPEHAPTAVWGGLVGRLEVHSVPAECALVASRHAEYVANWLFNRIQDAAERTSLDDDDAIICYGKAHPHQLAPHIADGHYAETQVPGVGPPAPARRDQSTARPCA